MLWTYDSPAFAAWGTASNILSSRITNLFNVKGQVAFVTGGGTGIGLMISQALAANGMKVYIGGRRTDVIEKTAKTYEGEIIPVEVSQASSSTCFSGTMV